MKKSTVGFSLIELMVSITIIGVLSAVLYANFADAGKQSRDAKRQADLRLLQSAVELYKNENGRYPEGCNAATDLGTWSAQPGSGANECASGGQYIKDLAPKYIPALPVDPKLNGTGSGYKYTVDVEGMVYKIMAENTVESETVDLTHPFARCGESNNSSAECVVTPGLPHAGCSGYAYNSCGNILSSCTNPPGPSYAVYGGYANGGIRSNKYYSTEQAREYFSDRIKCK